jgi:hypothetical protein
MAAGAARDRRDLAAPTVLILVVGTRYCRDACGEDRMGTAAACCAPATAMGMG